MIRHIKSVEEFDTYIQGTVLVDFFATWCGPCRMLTPVIEDVDQKGLLGVDVLKVDVDELPAIAMRYGIQSIPTLIVFKDGKIVRSGLGYMPAAQLVDFVKKSID